MSLNEYNNQPRPAAKKRPAFPSAGMLVIAAVILAAVSFVGGMQYQKGKTPAATTKTTAAQGAGSRSGFGGGFNRGDRALGTVTAVSSTSISVQTRSGSSKTYTITSSTTVTDNGQSSSVSDIQTGDTVIMTLDSSNTQDVSSIMLNPSFGGGFGGGNGGGSNTSSPTDSNTNDDSQTTGA